MCFWTSETSAKILHKHGTTKPVLPSLFPSLPEEKFIAPCSDSYFFTKRYLSQQGANSAVRSAQLR